MRDDTARALDALGHSLALLAQRLESKVPAPFLDTETRDVLQGLKDASQGLRLEVAREIAADSLTRGPA